MYECMFRDSLAALLKLIRHLRREPILPVLLLIIAGSLWVFIEISEDIHHSSPHDFDHSILLAMRESGNPSDPIGSSKIEEMGRDLTALGGFTILTGLTLVSIGVALIQRRPKIAFMIAVSITSGTFLTSIIKKGFDRPRPDLVPHGVVVTNASFPSGHAMMSAIVYLTLGLLLARTQPSPALRIYFIVISVILTLLVGISRIYLGVHWPTDVLAGWTLGAAWALLCWVIVLYTERRTETQK